MVRIIEARLSESLFGSSMMDDCGSNGSVLGDGEYKTTKPFLSDVSWNLGCGEGRVNNKRLDHDLEADDEDNN